MEVTIGGLDDGGGGESESGDESGDDYNFVHYLFYYNKVSGLESTTSFHFVEKAVKLSGKR